jgi:hypothetical protein
MKETISAKNKYNLIDNQKSGNVKYHLEGFRLHSRKEKTK